MTRRTIFFSGAVALAAIFLGGAMLYRSAQSRASGPQANLALLDRPHAPTVGPANAPVTIVEFLDPACETCATFYPMVKELMAAHPGQIRLVLRWAPFHPGSQQVVALLEAARRQDKFWPALETLLSTQPYWAINHTADAERAWQQLGALGLDVEKVRADMASAEIGQLIAQDVADAGALNVTQTPEYFVNGRGLPSFGFEQLQQLVTDALKQSRR